MKSKSELSQTPAHEIIEQTPTGDLRPWSRNARTHSRKQLRQLADSIEKFGFTNPVLIDEEGKILAGHGRVEAAKMLGLKTVPCRRIGNMTTRISAPMSSRTTNSP